MKKMLFYTILLFASNLALAQDRHDKIQSWEPVTPSKGYILSNDLYHKKLCDKIYTKQIPLFKEKNPHIKNPNLIMIDQTIWVQNCVSEQKELVTKNPTKSPSKNKKETPTKSNFFIGAYFGGSFLSEKENDTEKIGYNLGAKLGYEFGVSNLDNLGLALGYLYNEGRSTHSAGNGKFKIQNQMASLETYYVRNFTKKSRSGALINVIAGDDISMKEKNTDNNIGVYLGGTTLYKISNSVDLEANLQQRIDDVSRFNMLLNFGARLNF